ncbi:MAG: FHA domain-containing protein [Anaerolineae bacterium]
MRLRIRKGPGAGNIMECTRVRFSIGRSRANDIPLLGDWQVSRRHCEVLRQGWHWILVDVGSTNGTRVNGRRIYGPTVLRHGDVISLGESEIEVLMAGEEFAGDGGFPHRAFGTAALAGAAVLHLAGILLALQLWR